MELEIEEAIATHLERAESVELARARFFFLSFLSRFFCIIEEWELLAKRQDKESYATC